MPFQADGPIIDDDDLLCADIGQDETIESSFYFTFFQKLKIQSVFTSLRVKVLF